MDVSSPQGTRLMLDVELKITAGGDLALKQIRPFLADPCNPGAAVCPD